VADTDKAGQGFLARWSQRKTRARAGTGDDYDPFHGPEEAEDAPLGGTRRVPGTEPHSRPPQAVENDGNDPARGVPFDGEREPYDEEASEDRPVLLTDADMPPLDSLGPDSDYSGFLSRGVSQALRRQALRRLFTSPHLNIVDGLDDYAEDFTGLAPLGDTVTAEMRYRLEQAARVAAAGLEADPAVAGAEGGQGAEPYPVVPSVEADRECDSDGDAARIREVSPPARSTALSGPGSEQPNTGRGALDR